MQTWTSPCRVKGSSFSPPPPGKRKLVQVYVGILVKITSSVRSGAKILLKMREQNLSVLRIKGAKNQSIFTCLKCRARRYRGAAFARIGTGRIFSGRAESHFFNFGGHSPSKIELTIFPTGIF